MCHVKQEQWKDANRYLEKSSKLATKVGDVAISSLTGLQGYILLQQGQVLEAIPHFLRSIECKGNPKLHYFTNRNNVGLCYLKLKRYEQALKAFKKI